MDPVLLSFAFFSIEKGLLLMVSQLSFWVSHRKGPYIFQKSCFLEAFSQEVKILVSMGSMGFIILNCPPLLNVCKFFVKCHRKCSGEYVPLAF